MSIPTESYDSILEKYCNAIKWMERLGIKLGPNRTAHYEMIASYWAGSYSSVSVEEAKETFPDLVSSMFEIHDFVDIYEAFKDVPESELSAIVKKLRKGVNGPINAAEETPNSTTARNYIFEALVAARAHRPEKGVMAILDSPSDTGIAFHGKKLWVECKRVTSLKKLEANAKKASTQLEKLLCKLRGTRNRGVVAMDVSKILNRGEGIFPSQNDTELLNSINAIMDQFIEQHSEKWQSVYKRRHKKIMGTIVRFSFMSTSEARNILVHTSQWAVNPRKDISSSDSALLKAFAETLDNEKQW